jgi:hypothetical protein
VLIPWLVVILTPVSILSQESSNQPPNKPPKHEILNSEEQRKFVEEHSFTNPSYRQKLREINATATSAQGSPQVRMIYLVPSDKNIRSDYQSAIGNAISDLQLFFRNQLGGKTFSLHSPTVEVYQTNHSTTFYTTADTGSNSFFSSVITDGFALSGGGFNDPNNLWVFYVDADPPCGQTIGGGGGVALLAGNDLRGLTGQPNIPACPNETPDLGGINRWIGGLGHEIGHAFGLSHPPGCDQGACTGAQFAATSLMWAGYAAYPTTHLLDDDESLLLASQFFNFLTLDPSEKYSIHGSIKLNESTPISGATVKINETQMVVVTDLNGDFNFSSLPAGGNYTVSAAAAGALFEPESVLFNNLDRNQVANFSPRQFAIAGRVTGSGNPLAGVTVTLSGFINATTTTDNFGNYGFPAVTAVGIYLIKPVDTSIYTFNSQSITALDSNKTIDFAGTAKVFAITGRVSLNNNGMPGVTVFVAGSQSGDTVTDANGNYLLSGLAGGGSYSVIPSKADYTFAPPNQTFNQLDGNKVADFTAHLNFGIPILISEENSTRGLALDSVLRLREPFQPTYQIPWSVDRRTRLILFATNFELANNETAAAVTAEAEDSTHLNHFLPVEQVAKVPGFAWLNFIIVRLDVAEVGDVLVRIRYRGISSNRVRVGVGHIGGGLLDDPGAVPTPGRPPQ